ncbi:hypothetical protein M3M39_07275 [Fructilactobacillus hinvesii]|uniref:Uncharacterized protein n=1 Tax=Fructilactobacillus hinvesii TaxID=2940300 RepID=A0ABY5BTH9_9LACO|nr:hypothetical protein [Fructilactobacillus hinvesii]USS87881.1 hypothetical protein M3M39_07275 [Fructilactobacillus hinvesii]
MLNNLIYLRVSVTERFGVAWGITAADFINGVSEIPHSILLLNDDFERSNRYNSHAKFPLVVGRSQVREYILGEPGSKSNTKWINYQTEDGIDSLTDGEIADLLYLGHMGIPTYQRTPFLGKLRNQIVYVGGNNGFKRIYFLDFAEQDHILALSIKRHLREFRNSRRIFSRPLPIKDLDQVILDRLIWISRRGMILAFDLTKEIHRRFEIPVFVKKAEPEKVIWSSVEQLQAETGRVGTLTYNTMSNKWTIELDEQHEDPDLNDFV